MSLDVEHFKFVDAMNFTTSKPTVTSIFKQYKTENVKTFKGETLEQLYKFIQQECFVDNSPECILLDHIDLLLFLYNENIFDFLHLLRRLCQKNNTTIVMLVHSDTGETNMIEHMSNMIFDVKPLESGYSKDVHGQVYCVKYY